MVTQSNTQSNANARQEEVTAFIVLVGEVIREVYLPIQLLFLLKDDFVVVRFVVLFVLLLVV